MFMLSSGKTFFFRINQMTLFFLTLGFSFLLGKCPTTFPLYLVIITVVSLRIRLGLVISASTRGEVEIPVMSMD